MQGSGEGKSAQKQETFCCHCGTPVEIEHSSLGDTRPQCEEYGRIVATSYPPSRMALWGRLPHRVSTFAHTAPCLANPWAAMEGRRNHAVRLPFVWLRRAPTFGKDALGVHSKTRLSWFPRDLDFSGSHVIQTVSRRGTGHVRLCRAGGAPLTAKTQCSALEVLPLPRLRRTAERITKGAPPVAHMERGRGRGKGGVALCGASATPQNRHPRRGRTRCARAFSAGLFHASGLWGFSGASMGHGIMA